MDISIEIIAVDVINKGKYKVAEVTHKQDGKTNTKKVMSFGAQEQAFKFLSSDKVKKGDVYTVEINKNPEGYWDWTKVTFGEVNNDTGGSTATSQKAVAAPQRGNYETPEERMARQVYIIRQSSISNAVEYLNHNKKNYDVQEILGLASTFEEYIFGKSSKKETTGSISEMEDDIPY